MTEPSWRPKQGTAEAWNSVTVGIGTGAYEEDGIIFEKVAGDFAGRGVETLLPARVVEKIIARHRFDEQALSAYT